MRRLLTTLLALVCAATGAQADVPRERGVLRLLLNGEPRGDVLVWIDEQGDVLLPAAALEGSELELPSADPVSLRSLEPQLRFELEHNTATLRVWIEPALLGTSALDLGQRAPPDLAWVGGDSAFLNYATRLRYDERTSSLEGRVPSELGLRWGPAVLLSGFNYETQADPGFVRLGTSVVVDDVEALRRVTLGDFSTSGDLIGSAPLLGGLSVASHFGLQPYFVPNPQPSLAGVLQTASEIEVRLDGIPVAREELPAGQFELENLPARVGSGQAQVRIRDAFGRSRDITRDFYLASRLLRPGLHDYAYQGGLRRERFGLRSFEYGDFVFLGRHRVGLGPWLTLGFRAEADPDLANLGPRVDLGLGGLGELSLGFSFSLMHGRAGGAAFARYLRRDERTTATLSVRTFSPDYATVTPSSFPSLDAFGSFSVGSAFGSVVTAQLGYTAHRNRDDLLRAGLAWSRPLWKRVSLFVRGGVERTDDVRPQASVGLVVFLGDSTSAGLGARVDDDRLGGGVSLQRSAPAGMGYGYRVETAVSDLGRSGQQEFAEVSGEYRGHHQVLSAGFQRSDDWNRYDVEIAGALVGIEGSVFATRPVGDSFALVQVADVADVHVRFNHQRAGVTDDRGRAIVPEMRSFVLNQLSIEPKRIPFGYKVEELRKHVTTPFRTGGVVEFGVSQLRAYAGRLWFAEGSRRENAEYAGLEVEADGEVLQSVVGIGGEFYLEELAPGRYHARVYDRNRSCRFELVLLDEPGLISDLGDVTCDLKPSPNTSSEMDGARKETAEHQRFAEPP